MSRKRTLGGVAFAPFFDRLALADQHLGHPARVAARHLDRRLVGLQLQNALFLLDLVSFPDRLTSVKMYRRLISEDVLVSEESHVYDSAGNEIETTHAIPAARDTSDKSPATPASLAASRSRKTTRTFDNFGNVSSEEMVETVQGTVTSRKKKQVRYARFD